jgi:peptidoglycan/xylan/chitin deacetylase (PgdA/CDA1 family)
MWDYDGALGQINATYPYNYHEEALLEEIQNVDFILQSARTFAVKMTFACLGFSAEPGHWPYHAPDQLRRIDLEGHEIASHSWRHEWFPYLEREQVVRSLRRSKLALETCLGKPGSVVGFVPPFNRPMSWLGRTAFSLGDRTWGRRFPGSDLGGLLKILQAEGYRWCRTTYVPLWNRLLRRGPRRSLSFAGKVLCVPHHGSGFDESVLRMLRHTAASDGALFISGHPAALSRNGAESRERFEIFMRTVAEYQQQGKLKTCPAKTLVEAS